MKSCNCVDAGNCNRSFPKQVTKQLYSSLFHIIITSIRQNIVIERSVCHGQNKMCLEQTDNERNEQERLYTILPSVVVSLSTTKYPNLSNCT